MRASSLLISAGAIVTLVAMGSGFADAAQPLSADGCEIVAEPPFLYGTVVLPLSSVECDSQRRRLRIITTLTRDGVEASADRRDCRNTSTCYLDVDALAPDEPQDQVWCTHAKGYVDGQFIGAASACESDTRF